MGFLLQVKGDVCKKINILAQMVANLPYEVWFWTTVCRDIFKEIDSTYYIL